MRVILSLLFLLNSYTFADEIDRIESIVKEIETLRSNYVKVEEKLEITQHRFRDLQEKNSILESELELYSNYSQKEEDYSVKIKSLEKKIKSLEKKVKTKQSIDNNCKNIIVKKRIVKEKVDNTLFPNLKMKEKYKDFEIEYTQANTFRTNKQAEIYDTVEGTVVANWEEGRSFTSNEKTSQWIKITGYFVEKVWKASQEELWIKQEDTKLREIDN